MSMTGTQVKIRVQGWLMDMKEVPSRHMVGAVLDETPLAIRFYGAALVEPSNTCLRCKRTMRALTSRKIGYGRECCPSVGIPVWAYRDGPEPDVLQQHVLHAKAVDVWLPRKGVKFLSVQTTAAPEAQVTVDGGYIQVSSKFQHKDRFKAIDGMRWNPKVKVWECVASIENAENVREALAGIGMCKVSKGFQKLLIPKS